MQRSVLALQRPLFALQRGVLTDELLVLLSLPLVHAQQALMVAERALPGSPRLVALPLPRLRLHLQGGDLTLQHCILGHERGALGGDGGVLHLRCSKIN